MMYQLDQKSVDSNELMQMKNFRFHHLNESFELIETVYSGLKSI